MRRSPEAPLIIAHRGSSAVAPEGTRAAIRQAVRAGAQMVELDVQMTLDGRLVVFHDDRLERATDGKGRLIGTRYAQLTRLDAGSWFHPRFAGERVLLVSQAVRLIPKHVRLNLELKRSPRRLALLRRLLRLVRRQRLAQRILFSSFEPRLLRPLRSAGFPIALICRKAADRSLYQATQLRCEAWHPFHALVTRRRIIKAHAAGLRVHTWTVDDPKRARQLVRWGIDGVFTNHPARLRRFMR
ncbi:MAG: glycerophosphodiester phosphodiesterase [Candidatus Omnitrophica bacterium]|nr:glycerophosphodiester phosphodiesterase [Candidatus Omnitrophota bacterium]